MPNKIRNFRLKGDWNRAVNGKYVGYAANQIRIQEHITEPMEAEKVAALNHPSMTLCERYHCKLSENACVCRILRAHKYRVKYHDAVPFASVADVFCLKCDQGERNLAAHGIVLSEITSWQ